MSGRKGKLVDTVPEDGTSLEFIVDGADDPDYPITDKSNGRYPNKFWNGEKLHQKILVLPSGNRTVHYMRPSNFVPVLDFPSNHLKSGQVRCSGWTLSEGRQCKFAVEGHSPKFCRFHRRGAKSGIKHPRFTSGAGSSDTKYTRSLSAMSQTVQEAYNSSLENIERMYNLDEEIALTDAQIAYFLERLTYHDRAWLGDLAYDLQSCVEVNDWKEVEAIAHDIQEFVDSPSNHIQLTSRTLDRLKESRRKLVETHTKANKEFENSIPVEICLGIIGTILYTISNIVKAYVPDEKLATTIIGISERRVDDVLAERVKKK